MTAISKAELDRALAEDPWGFWQVLRVNPDAGLTQSPYDADFLAYGFKSQAEAEARTRWGDSSIEVKPWRPVIVNVSGASAIDWTDMVGGA